MRYDLKVINNMVCETFNGKIINENTFDVINNNESCFIHKSNDKNKADIIIKLIKVFEDLSKGEYIVLKYIIESKIKLYEEYNKLSYSFDANSDFYIDIKQSTGYGYINAKDSLNSLYKKNISEQSNFNYNFIMNKFINYLKAGDSEGTTINKSKN